MKSKFRIIAFLLSSLMVIGLTACGGATDTPSKDISSEVSSTQNEEKPDTSKAVELTMYLLGDRTTDFDKVFGKINDKMSEKINAKLNVKFMSWSEYEQKYPLVFASGEDWDIIYSADWAYYNSQATKQGFWEITENNLKKYAPMTADTMYPDAWKQSKIDGKAYMLPMNYKEITSYVYIARGDLMKKYNITSVSSLNEVEAYCDAIIKNDPSLIPIDIGSDYDAMFMFDRMWTQAVCDKLESIGPWQVMACVDKNSSSLEVKGQSDNKEFLDVITRLKNWKDRGFWSKSAPVNTQNNRESFAAGKSGLALMNINTAKSEYANISAAHPEWNIQIFDAQGNAPSIVQSFLANGMCIFSKSKNPERALMALDLLRNDEDINSLFCYGIEGLHWKAAGKDKLVSLEAASNYPYDGNCNWGIRNDKLWRTIEGGIQGLDKLTAKWNQNAETPRFVTFNFNDAKVKNKIAAIKEIFATDYKLLGLGFTNDPAVDIAKMQAKLKAAGAEEVYAEIQNQAKEFLK